MRKSFLTKEYTLEPRPGTLSMLEKRNFFGSKILEIPDILNVDENDIIWSESVDSTQGINIDDQTKNLDVSNLKEINHAIIQQPRQSERDILEYTLYEIRINIKQIIREWIFAQLKRNLTFAGIRNEETAANNIDQAVYSYIDLNVFPRIKFSTINLYVRYVPIGSLDYNGQVALQYDINFQENSILPATISGESTEQLLARQLDFKRSLQVSNFELTLDAFSEFATIIYKQTQSSRNFKWDYYFDVVYVKA